MKRLLVTACLGFYLAGCASVNVRVDNLPESTTPPSFEQTYVYWWWGLKGEHTVNVREVCKGNDVYQMQAVNSFSDSVISILTLGIYSKRTARVWCEETT